ncbi:YqaA family protein [Bacteroides heparinolyticus]|uniref:YqaA family protein n=1 Tax=Prevotella heparinolytica TaxID=28113 RepID=UPI0035A09FC3
MDSLIDFLIAYGYPGMFVSAFIAGSIFPLSSEAVLVALLAAGLQPWPLLLVASTGNWAGSMLNYGIGRMGKIDWIEKYLHVDKKSLGKARRFMGGHGAWMGFFSFLPFIGEAISVVLGLMRANILITCVSTAIGKALRYLALMYGASLFL